MSIYGVLTGDIVASTKLPAGTRSELPEILFAATEEARESFAEAISAPAQVFRGDSFQIVLSEPRQALAVSLYIRCAIRIRVAAKKADVRIAIGLGPVDALPEGRDSSGSGEAFVLSGRCLEALSRNRRLGLATWHREANGEPPGGGGVETPSAIDVVLGLLDWLASGWTERQCVAVSGALKGWTQEVIAHHWPGRAISQQAVAQHLDRVGWASIEPALAYFEAWVDELVDPG